MGYITEEGARRLALMEEYGLEAFYQEHVGNLIIPEYRFTYDIRVRVLAFLRNNTEWIMGFEKPDEQAGYYWLNTLEDVRIW